MRSEAGTRTCKGAVKEIEYIVYITPVSEEKKAYLKMTSIVARVVVADITQADGDTSNMHVQQKFSLEFLQVTEPDTVTVGLSGNPGYIVGLPLLLGFNSATDEGAIKTYKGGFIGTGAKPDGAMTSCQNPSDCGIA